jgi:hypothetical protein
MKKQTAVAFFADKLIECLKFNEPEAFEHYMLTLSQALEMEREQIKDAVGVGSQFDRDYLYGYHDKAEQYYKETYGQD